MVNRSDSLTTIILLHIYEPILTTWVSSSLAAPGNCFPWLRWRSGCVRGPGRFSVAAWGPGGLGAWVAASCASCGQECVAILGGGVSGRICSDVGGLGPGQGANMCWVGFCFLWTRENHKKVGLRYFEGEVLSESEPQKIDL